MTDRLSKNIDRLAREANNIARLAREANNIDRLAREANVELTPEVRNFAWLVNQDALQGFWEAAQQYAKYEQEKVASFLILKGES